MKKNTQLIPAILARDFIDFKNKVKFLESSFDLAQIDVMDGKFVDNKTFYNLEKIKKIKTRLNYELHLMVSNPQAMVKMWYNYNKIKRIIVHFESFKDKNEINFLIRDLQKKKIKFGLAINPETKLAQVLCFLDKIDLLVVMGVTPGWSGQKFQSKVLSKIKKTRKDYPNLDIAVDGGVNEKNMKKIIQTGANVIMSASMVFKNKNINNLKK